MFILQVQLNKSFNVATKLSLNKVIYNFKIKKALLLLYNSKSTRDNIVNKQLKYCTKVANAILFANAKTKIYYNAKYILLILRLDNCIYLYLNYNYYLFDKSNKKILLQ